MPEWIGSHAAAGQPLEEADIQPFLLDQPLIKFPYFTGGEVTKEQIAQLVADCNAMTYRP
jgi:hypothetical protein